MRRDDRQLALFHRTLAEMCRAGMPLHRAFGLLEADLAPGPLKDAAHRLAADVAHGEPLPAAYRRCKGAFPPLYAALVEAGVAAGDLPGALTEISRHAALRAEVHERLRRSIASPLITAIFVLGLGGVVLINLMVGPQFGDIFAGLNVELPAVTRLVVRSPHIWVGIQLGLLALVGLAAFAWAWLSSPLDAPAGRTPIGLKLPVVGPIRTCAELATLSATLALVLRRGLPLARALDLAAEADRGPLHPRVLEMARGAAEGLGLAGTAGRARIYPPTLAWLLEAAERQGAAVEALDDIAKIYRDRLARAVEGATTVSGPILEVLVGIVVLGIGMTVIAVFLPIMKLVSALQ